MIGRKIGALCAKMTVALPGACRLPTAGGRISLFPEQAQDGDTSEGQRRPSSISSMHVGIERPVGALEIIRLAVMAPQMLAGNRSNSRHPARAGQTELPADQ